MGEKMENYIDVFFRRKPEPVYCYRSGLTVYEERLLNGVLVSGGWNAAGYPLNVLSNMASHINNDPFAEPSTFHVELDGECVDFFLEEGDFQIIEKEDGCKEAILRLKSTVKSAEIAIHTLLDGTAMITRWLEITNLSDDSMAVSRLSVFSGALEQVRDYKVMDPDIWPEDIYELGYFADTTWGKEGKLIWKDLELDKKTLAGRFGRARFRHPAFFLRNKLNGQMFFGQLGWSAGYELSFDYIAEHGSADVSLGIDIAIADHHPLYWIEAGETFVSPQVHIGVVFGNLDEAVNETYAHIRRSVLTLPEAAGEECLITAGMGPEHNMTMEESMCFAKQMAELGAEVFTVDAGWYCPPNKEMEWWERIGDWHYDPERYPDGIEKLRDYVHSLGMKFGLWMEAERIGEWSACFAEHPEWCTKLPFRTDPVGFLDFTNPAVISWTEEQIAHVISDYKLDLFRVDYNVGSEKYFYYKKKEHVEYCSVRHYQAVYAMYERLKKRFPDVIFENCAGGGGRTDLGMLRAFHHTWVSDWQKAPRSLSITSGMTMVLPPERVDRLVAGMGCHEYGALDFQMRNTMFGHMTLNTFSPAAARFNVQQLSFIKHSVALYKDFIRPFLSSARMYHHNETPSNAEKKGYCALELVSCDKTKAVIGIFCLQGQKNLAVNLVPCGLDVSKDYKVIFDNTGTERTISGWELMKQGITTLPLSALTSELILFEAVTEV